MYVPHLTYMYTESFEVLCQAAPEVPRPGKCYANRHANLISQIPHSPACKL